MATPVIGVLALQGAFREHIQAMRKLDMPTREIRQLKDLEGISAMIIPGGESTTIGKLLVDLDIMEPLKQKIATGMPVFGTCAGLILLCRDIENSSQPRLGQLNATVRRNAFGRQVDSFEADLPLSFLDRTFPAVFIRAPILLQTGNDVQVLGEVEEYGKKMPVAVRQDNILATSFHPELTEDLSVHRYFLDICAKNRFQDN